MPNTPVVISGNIVSDGSTQNNTIVVTSLSIGEIFSEALSGVREHIVADYSNDNATRNRLLGYFGVIQRHFEQHTYLLQNLSDTLCCKKNADLFARKAHLERFIHYCLSAQMDGHSLQLPTVIDTGILILNEMRWACTGARTQPMNAKTSIAALSDMLNQNPALKCGTYYLFHLCNLDCSSTCPNGSQGNGNWFTAVFRKIFGCFLNGPISESSRTFMDIPVPANITVKCGECLSNISELNKSRGKL